MHVLRLVAAWAAVAVLAPAVPASTQGGGGIPLPDAPAAPTDAPKDSELSAEDKARRKQVVARVGDVIVTVGEIEDSINAQSPFLRNRYRDPERLREYARNMIRFELLAREARRRGYDEHPAIVHARKKNIVQQLVRRSIDDELRPESIPEEDVKAYYENHPDKYRRPDMVRASHILLESKAEARELLDDAREADEDTFARLAGKHSADTETKMRGGDLRYFTKDGKPPGSEDPAVHEAIVKTALSLDEVGDVVSEPVKVGDRWSIVRLTGKRPAHEESFEDAKRGIRQRLWRKRRKEAIRDLVDKLRKRFDPTVHPKRIDAIDVDMETRDGGRKAGGGGLAGKPPEELIPSPEADGSPGAPASGGGTKEPDNAD